MLLREQYQEHSERDYLSVPLATYHFEQVTIPLHWHREVELILPQEAGELELEGQLHPYGPQELLCVNQGVLHRTWAPIPLADLLVVDLDSLLSPLLRQDGGSFLTRLAEGSLVFPLGVGRDTPAYRELAASFRACVGLVREKPPGWELPVQLELLKLLETYHSHGLLVERGPRASEPHTQAVKESIAYMRRNLDQELSLERLAGQAALPLHPGVPPLHRADALRLFKRSAPAGGRPLPGAGHDGERDGPPRGAGEFELLYPAVPPALWTNAQAVPAGAYFPQKMTQLLG